MKECSWCKRELPLGRFYRVTKDGAYRGQCKTCRAQITRLQRNPDWRAPCSSCGISLETRSTSGRRLCPSCYSQKYQPEETRPGGAPRLKLLPCIGCGGPKARFDRGWYCRSCRAQWLGDDRDPTNGKELEKARNLFQKYGLSLRQYEIMLERQGGVCVICHRSPGKRGLAVEHDHGSSKRVRGLACYQCNRHKIASNTAESAAIVAEYLASEFDARNL